MIKNLIYILQAEQYDRLRMLRFAYAHFLEWPFLAKRGGLKWTNRTKALYVVTYGLLVLGLCASWFLVHHWWWVGVIVLLLALPLLVVIADILLIPLERAQKKSIIAKGAAVIAGLPDLVVIGITGSYGKTTMKHMLHPILQAHGPTMTLEGNVNTEMGVAMWLSTHHEELKKTKYLIVEMGAFHRGDIAKLCALTKPQYGIWTALGEVHLERFGSLEQIGHAKSELISGVAKETLLNGRSQKLVTFWKLHETLYPRASIVTKEVSKQTWLPNFQGQAFIIEGVRYETKLIGTYVTELIALGIALAKKLGLSDAEIQTGVAKIPQVKHRLEVMHNPQTKVIVIDDSYNGNEAGFLAGIHTLSRAEGRKVVLTPGIVELGKRTKDVHRNIAHSYIQNVDLVLLVRNSMTKHMEGFFKEIGFTTYKVYDSAIAAHQDLPNVLKAGDTILFQNDLPDNYR